MAEETTESFVSTINVRELISIFENKKADNIDYSYSRPRAKSWGNILNDDVIVRYSDYYTLQDIQKALDQVETNLNFYQVYDKQKHVSFQEQLFNILTFVVNIETETKDGPAQKKTLLTKTQTLVSYLNQKLPNVRSPLKEIYTKNIAETKNDSEESLVFETENNTDNNITEPIKPVKDIDTDYTVSVKKLKEHFQTKDEPDAEILPTKITKLRTQKSHEVKIITNEQTNEKLITTGNDLSEVEVPQQENEDIESFIDENNKEIAVERKIPESEDIDPEEVAKVVSVSKLRNMFEEKSKEESAGLEIVLDAPKTFQYEVNIPYTERNLEKYRLYRTNSGNYMNYTGLLQQTDIKRNKADISRSKSMHAFNYDRYVEYKDRNKVTKRSSQDSGDESDTSSASIDSVKEVPVNQLSAVKVQLTNEERITRTVDSQNEEKIQSTTSSKPQESEFTIENQSTEDVQYSSAPTTIRVGNEEYLTRTVDGENEEKFQNSTLSDSHFSQSTITNESPSSAQTPIKRRPVLNKSNPFANDINKQIEKNNGNTPDQNENATESSTLTVKLNKTNDSVDSPDHDEIETQSSVLQIVSLLNNTNISQDPLNENTTRTALETELAFNSDNLVTTEEYIQATTEISSDKDQIDEESSEPVVELRSLSNTENEVVVEETQPQDTTADSLDKAEDKANNVTSEKKLLTNNDVTVTDGAVHSIKKEVPVEKTTKVFKASVEETQPVTQSKIAEFNGEQITISGYVEEEGPTYKTVNDVADISLSSINTVKTDFSIDEEALNTAEEDFDKLLASNEIH